MDNAHIFELPKRPTNEKEFIDLVRHIANYGGAVVKFDLESGELDDGTIDIALGCDSYIWAGDYNCPHQKAYDPRDGHGLTTIDLSEEHYGSNMYDQLWDMTVRFKEKQDTLIGTEPIKRV